MLVLAAYGETLETVALGADADGAGQIRVRAHRREGQRLGSRSTAPPSRPPATPRRSSPSQMCATGGKGDLAGFVKSAAPHVKTLCEGLTAYLEAQSKSLGDIEKEAEKKHGARSDRRCAQLDGRTMCVSESVVDRHVLRHAVRADGPAGEQPPGGARRRGGLLRGARQAGVGGGGGAAGERQDVRGGRRRGERGPQGEGGGGGEGEEVRGRGRTRGARAP